MKSWPLPFHLIEFYPFINLFLLILNETGSCKKATACPVSAWSSWTPAVNNGECKAQTRFQDKIPQTIFVSQLNNCNGILPDCHPNRVTSRRTFCKYSISVSTHSTKQHLNKTTITLKEGCNITSCYNLNNPQFQKNQGQFEMIFWRDLVKLDGNQ